VLFAGSGLVCAAVAEYSDVFAADLPGFGDIAAGYSGDSGQRGAVILRFV